MLRQDRAWAQLQTPQHFRAARPLALRYEALLRAFNDPAPYARRLAARLYAAPQRVRDLLGACPDADRRVERFSAFDDAAHPKAPIFNTS